MAMLVLAVMACMARAAVSGARVSEMAMRRANNARAAAKIRHLRSPIMVRRCFLSMVFTREAAPGSLDLAPPVAAHAVLASRSVVFAHGR